MMFAYVAAFANPCDGVSRTISEKDKQRFAPEIARQLRAQNSEVVSVRVLQYFAYKEWRVIYVDTQVSDEVFLIFHGSPLTGRYLDTLSGAYAMDEEKSAYGQLINGKSRGIPPKLARCIAWHIAKNGENGSVPIVLSR